MSRKVRGGGVRRARRGAPVPARLGRLARLVRLARLAVIAPLALVLAAPLACRRERAPDASAPPSSSAAAPASAAPRPPSPRLTDPRWRRAAGDDPLEQARLAEAEGASGLLAGLEDGGDIAAAALRALPYADDADLALGPLAARARAAPPSSLPPLLDALLGIAGRPPRQREPLDPDGARAAAAALVELSGRRDVPAEQRAVAISAARALADKGLVDPRLIPGDLDPEIPGAGAGGGQAPRP
ncbi:MAG TPA: thiamine biosynthesis protein [Sorangium sp.]|nr:thiamine biosynthesis protein [Sorangium sp.]